MASNNGFLQCPQVCIEEVFEREIEKQCALVEDENIRDALSLMLNLVKQVKRSTIKRSEEQDSRHRRLLSSLGHVGSQEERCKLQRPSSRRPPGGRLLTAKEVDAVSGAGHATACTLAHVMEPAATQEEALERHPFQTNTEPSIAPILKDTLRADTPPPASEASSDDAPRVAAKNTQAARPLADCADVMPKKADRPLRASAEMGRQQSLRRASADPQDAAASVHTTARLIDRAAPAQGQRAQAGRVDSVSSFGRVSSRDLSAWNRGVADSAGGLYSHPIAECGPTPDTKGWRGIWQEQFDGMRSKMNFGKTVSIHA